MPKKKARKSHIWKKHPDNWYVEAPWCVSRLFDVELFIGGIHDPCCGMGMVPDAAVSAGFVVSMSDIKDRGASKWWGPDFTITRYQDDDRIFDNIVTNPPFDDINKKPWPFIEWALAHAKNKVAILVPFKWLAGDSRTRYLQSKPVVAVHILTPRPSMPPGPALLAMWDKGISPQGGKEDFAWVIFEPKRKPRRPPMLGWIHRDKDT